MNNNFNEYNCISVLTLLSFTALLTAVLFTVPVPVIVTGLAWSGSSAVPLWFSFRKQAIVASVTWYYA
jgi:hypothetical protein